MDVHVDEAGEESLARKVDPLRAGGDVRTGAAAADDRDDSAVGDHDHRLLHDLAGENVDHSVGGDDDALRAGGRGCSEGGEGGGGEEEKLHLFTFETGGE